MRVPQLVATIAAAAVIVVGAGTLVLAHGGDTSLIHSCVNHEGDIRIISAGAVCKQNEVALDWNNTGPIGATGPKGTDGAAGPAGAAGPTGPAGVAGRDGRDGLAGAKGDTGPQGLAGKSGAADEIVVGQLSATATVDGVITGGTGTATFMDVRSFSTSVSSPRDLATGQASGKRQHKPLIVTKSMDAATPLFQKVLDTNEVLTSVVLKIYRSGTTTVDQTITLTNAGLSQIDTVDTGAGDALPLERLSFTFQKIKYEFSVNGGVRSYEDSLVAP
jgi:type VI secretion system Hcp family effector